MPDCGDNSCRYAPQGGGMRTNGGCRCDQCPECGATILLSRRHRVWCSAPAWVPEHQRGDHRREVER